MVEFSAIVTVSMFMALSSMSYHYHRVPLHYRLPTRPDAINYPTQTNLNKYQFPHIGYSPDQAPAMERTGWKLRGVLPDSQGFSMLQQFHTPAQNLAEDESPRAICILLAGLGDTVEKFHHLADLLACKGFAVHGMDYPGWGFSQRQSRKGSSYEPCLTKNWTKDVCDEVIHFTEDVATRYQPGLKKFVIAPSLGGATALATCLLKPELFDGAVLLCPAIKSDVKPVLQMLVPWLAMLFPRMGAGQVGDEDIGSRNLFIADNIASSDLMKNCRLMLKSPYSVLTDASPQQKDETKSNQPLPVVTAAALVYLLQFLKDRMHEMKVPFLVLHGQKDLVINPEGSRLLHASAAATDKTIKWYPEAWHELLYEPEWKEVMADIEGWVEARAPPLKRAEDERSQGTASE